jgi:hypothetical protein
MNRKQRRRSRKPSVPQMDAKLREGLHRLSQRDKMFCGFALACLRACRQQTVTEQAADLGISEGALAALAMCRTPRPDHHDEDLAAVAGKIGVGIELLRKTIHDAASIAP